MAAVRVALFSDVHANRAALSAVLRAIDQLDPDHVFVLGDLVGRGPEPQAVVKMIAGRGIRALRGNWDEWVAGADGWDQRPKRKAWVEAARALMKKRARESIGEAPERRRLIFEGLAVVLAHGSPRNPVELLVPATSDEDLAAAIAGADADVVAVGHSHQPFVRRLGRTLVINVGCVGYPFNGDPRACFALLSLDAEKGASAELIRVPYALEDNLRAMQRAVERGIVAAELAERYGRALLGEGPEPFEELRDTDRGSELLVKLLAKRTRAVYAGESLEKIVEDVEAVRSLRAATRKLREALALARSIAGESDLELVMERLTDLGHQLGQRRTADVLAAHVGNAAPELASMIQVRRRRTTERLVDRYSRARRIEEGLAIIALSMKPRDETTPLFTLARELLLLRRARIEDALSAIELPEARDAHHALRIQLRRLRHGAEMLGPALPEWDLEPIAALAKTMHAALGRLNDAYEVERFLSRRRVSRVGFPPALRESAAETTRVAYAEAKSRLAEHAPDLLARLRQILR